MDAVKELAAEAGMEVPAADPRAAKKAEEAASLRDVTQAAADWFTQQLGSSNGAPAREYLAKRGIAEATRKDRKSDVKGKRKSVRGELGGRRVNKHTTTTLTQDTNVSKKKKRK